MATAFGEEVNRLPLVKPAIEPGWAIEDFAEPIVMDDSVVQESESVPRSLDSKAESNIMQSARPPIADKPVKLFKQSSITEQLKSTVDNLEIYQPKPTKSMTDSPQTVDVKPIVFDALAMPAMKLESVPGTVNQIPVGGKELQQPIRPVGAKMQAEFERLAYKPSEQSVAKRNASIDPPETQSREQTVIEVKPQPEKPAIVDNLEIYQPKPTKPMADSPQTVDVKPIVFDALAMPAMKLESVPGTVNQIPVRAKELQQPIRPVGAKMQAEFERLAYKPSEQSVAKRNASISPPETQSSEQTVIEVKPRPEKLAVKSLSQTVLASPYSFIQQVKPSLAAKPIQTDPMLTTEIKPVAEIKSNIEPEFQNKLIQPQPAEIIAKPAVNSLLPSPIFKSEPKPQTTLKLSIGRIQVRAKQTEPPVPAKSESKSARLSLADYLQQTNQGRLS